MKGNATVSFEELEAKTRDELRVIARRLGIPRYGRLSKSDLISAIVEVGKGPSADGATVRSWFQRQHSHVYGIAGVIGVLASVICLWLTIVLFAPKGAKPSGPTSEAIETTVDQAGRSGNAIPVAPEVPILSPTSAPEDEEGRIATNAKAFLPTTIDDLCARLYSNPIIAIIERDQLQTDLPGKTVIWTAKIARIDAARKDNAIDVMVHPPKDEAWFVFLEFDRSQWGQFLRLGRGQTIRFSGVIEELTSHLALKDCRLLKVVG